MSDIGLHSYRTIVADPPWRYRQERIVTTANKPWTKPEAKAQYPTMTDAEIAALSVERWADKNAHLYVWVTNPKLASVFSIIEAWGFHYQTLLTWEKQGTLGLGSYFRGQTEHVAFATRGRAPIPPSKRERNLFAAPKRGHSIKPDSFLDMVERVSAGPHLELFARRQRFGWDTWGNEALDHLEVVAGSMGRAEGHA